MRNSVKTIVLWLVSITVCVAMWNLFSAEPRMREPTPSDRSVWSGVASWLVCAGPLLVAFLVWRRVTTGPWAQANERGNIAFQRGRYLEALEEWTKSSTLAPKQPLPVYNAGMASLHLWRLAHARAQFEKVLAMPKPTIGFSIDEVRTAALATLRLVSTLEGRVSEEKALELPESAKRIQGHLDGIGQLTRAVTLCRELRFDDAHALLRTTEAMSLSGSIGVLGRTLASWCVVERGGPTQPVDRVALFSEGSGDELKAAWPEFAAFVATAPQV